MWEMNVWLSIIIPVYNTASFLERCLDGILRQDMNHCEIILVDDGSTDASPEICDRYATNYSNLHVVHQPNLGVSVARNQGLEISTGEYIWFVDSDDRVLPNALEYLYRECRKNKAQVINFPAIKEDEKKQRLGLIPAAKNTDFAERGPLLCGDPMYPFVHVLKRSLIGNERFNDDIKLLEDRDFLYRVLSKVTGTVSIMQVPLYAYLTTRSDSAMNTLHVEWNVRAAKVHYTIFINETRRGRVEPAYSFLVDYTLGTLALIARTGACSSNFSLLRDRMLRYDQYSSNLVGTTAFKYAICKRFPSLYQYIYAGLGCIDRVSEGMTSINKILK